MKKVRINEVGTRDGFQNVKEFIPTEVKLNILDGIVASGIDRVQVTSFVNPKAVPQMRDAVEVASAAVRKYPDVEFYGYIPNVRGAENAVSSGLKEMAFIISVSESHNMANLKMTLDESFAQLKEVKRVFPEIRLTLDAPTSFGCPVEGFMPYEKLKAHIARAQDLGIDHVTPCDTIGLSHPNQVKEYFTRMQEDFPEMKFVAHIHDTRGMGMINSIAAIDCGITDVEVAIAGLGGCPFAEGASGNTSTEDFVYMLHEMGYETGVDFDKLLSTAKYAKEHVKGVFSGHHINITRNRWTQ